MRRGSGGDYGTGREAAMKIVFVRRLVQFLAFGLLFLPLFWPVNHVWFGSYLSSRVLGVDLTDPLAALEVMLAGKAIWGPLIWSVIPLVLAALVLGRVFCGWICPMNTVFELAARLKASKVRGGGNGWMPYGVLILFLLLAFITGLPLFTMISPIGILSRAIAFGAGLELIFIAALIALEWFYDRKAWCRNICPAGALYGLLGKWRMLTVAVDHSNCRACRKCYDACTMRVTVGGSAWLDRLTCTNCGDCVAACPEKAVCFTWRNKQKGGTKQREFVDGITR